MLASCPVCGERLRCYGLHMRRRHGMSVREAVTLYFYGGLPPKCQRCGRECRWNPNRSDYNGGCPGHYERLLADRDGE